MTTTITPSPAKSLRDSAVRFARRAAEEREEAASLRERAVECDARAEHFDQAADMYRAAAGAIGDDE